MFFKKHSFTFTYLILFLLIITFTVTNSIESSKITLRKLWNERIDYDDSQRTPEEKESINHCVNSDYKYFIFYVTGQTYEFKEYINEGNAQPLINELTNKGQGNMSSYYDHIGVFFIFVGCAFVSIIVWIFNWICWKNSCCCCDFLHNPINKRIAWWFCFCFLWGIIACCISAFVTVNRFGFALEGSRCAVDRIYYDSKYGQLKLSQPRWEGFDNNSRILNYFDIFIDNVTGSDYFNLLVPEGWVTSSDSDNIKQLNGYFNQSFINAINSSTVEDEIKIINEYVLPFSIRYSKIAQNLWQLKNTINSRTEITRFKNFFINNDFEEMKNDFLDKFYYYSNRGKACLNVLTMIYYCILVITIFFSGVCMILYVCLKRQGYLLQIMHVLWNIIRFFIISLFLYGTAYGIFFLVLKDVIAYISFIFGERNLNLEKPYLLPKTGAQFLKYCLLENNANFKSKMNNITSSSLNDFFINYKEFGDLITDQNKISTLSNDVKTEVENTISLMKGNYNLLKINLIENLTQTALDELTQRAVSNSGLYGSFDCGFLKSNLQHLYRAIYDASIESRILCALSLCSSFFGAIAVYFFLLVMHHYDNEMFFDRGKNIFTGFDGFRGKTRNQNLDPGFKKRKMRTEIEMTSDGEEEENSGNKKMSKTNSKY